MSNAQYTASPMNDWSSEITRPSGTPQPSAHAFSTTSTTTTTTSSASAGQGQRPQMSQQPQMSQPVSVTTTTTQNAAEPGQSNLPAAQNQRPAAYNEFEGAAGALDMGSRQPIEIVEAPTTLNEAFLGSLKSMLLRNRGNFVTATFLIGTQGTTAWEGILHDVGNDYIIIYQPSRERYIACDIYSLKYIEFYDTKQRQMCEQLMRENGMRNYY